MAKETKPQEPEITDNIPADDEQPETTPAPEQPASNEISEERAQQAAQQFANQFYGKG